MTYLTIVSFALSTSIMLLPFLIEMYAFVASLATFPWQFIPLSVPVILFYLILAAHAGITTDATKPKCGIIDMSNPLKSTPIAFYAWCVCKGVNIILFAITIRGIETIVTWIVSIVLGIIVYAVHIFIAKRINAD
jgi:hypothetical protein